MYERLTLKKNQLIEIVKAEFLYLNYYHSPRNTALGSPYPIDLKKKTSPKKLHHIIANEKSSVAVFSVCLGAVIFKSALSPATGSLFLRLLTMSTMEKDGKGGRMMVQAESPRSQMAR